MDSQPESKSKLPNLKTWIAAVPAVNFLIFLFAYCYYFGYATKFEIPWQLVSLTWGNALAACLIAFMLVFFGLVIYIQTSGPKPAFYIVAISAILFGVGGILVSPHPFFTLLLFLTVVIIGLLRRRGQEKSDKQAATVEGKSKPEKNFAPLSKSEQGPDSVGSGPLYSSALILVALACWFSFEFGQYRASHQTEFYVVPTSPRSILLAEYGDTFVLEHFDKKTKKLEGGIIIMKLAEGSPLTLEREKVGALSPPKAQ